MNAAQSCITSRLVLVMVRVGLCYSFYSDNTKFFYLLKYAVLCFKKMSSVPGSRVCSRICFNFQLPVFTKTQSRWRNNAVQLLMVALKKQILTVLFLNNPYNFNKNHCTVNMGCSPITQSAQYVLLPDHCSWELCVAQCNTAQCSVAQFMVADWSVAQRTVGHCSEA